MIAHYYIQS